MNAGPSRPTFYSYKKSAHSRPKKSAPLNFSGAVMYSGACSSIVGKKTLEKTLFDMQMSGIPYATPFRENHRFGDNHEAQPTVCAVTFPLRCKFEKDNALSQFYTQFDEIEG